MIANAMLGDYREHCDSEGFELEQFAGCIPSNQVAVIKGRRKWVYLADAQRRWPNVQRTDRETKPQTKEND